MSDVCTLRTCHRSLNGIINIRSSTTQKIAHSHAFSCVRECVLISITELIVKRCTMPRHTHTHIPTLFNLSNRFLTTICHNFSSSSFFHKNADLLPLLLGLLTPIYHFHSSTQTPHHTKSIIYTDEFVSGFQFTWCFTLQFDSLNDFYVVGYFRYSVISNLFLLNKKKQQQKNDTIVYVVKICSMKKKNNNAITESAESNVFILQSLQFVNCINSCT